MTAALATLNPAALVTLADCELRIERGLRTFIDVGQALAEIRDSRLYKGTHDTFEDYCRERWNMTPQHANRLVLAADVVTSMEPIGSIAPPTNEGQARALAAVPEPERAEVWREANERTDGKPTAKVVKEIAEERATPAEPERKPLGTPETPGPAAATTALVAGPGSTSPAPDPVAAVAAALDKHVPDTGAPERAWRGDLLKRVKPIHDFALWLDVEKAAQFADEHDVETLRQLAIQFDSLHRRVVAARTATVTTLRRVK